MANIKGKFDKLTALRKRVSTLIGEIISMDEPPIPYEIDRTNHKLLDTVGGSELWYGEHWEPIKRVVDHIDGHGGGEIEVIIGWKKVVGDYYITTNSTEKEGPLLRWGERIALSTRRSMDLFRRKLKDG